MEHVLIKVGYDCFLLGFSFLRWLFITLSNTSNYWNSRTPGLRDNSSEVKREPCVCLCVCVCVCLCFCVSLCVCVYKTCACVLKPALSLKNIIVQQSIQNPRVLMRISLYIGEFPVLHSGKHSHPNKCISFW